jgi:hypothetical protein
LQVIDCNDIKWALWPKVSVVRLSPNTERKYSRDTDSPPASPVYSTSPEPDNQQSEKYRSQQKELDAPEACSTFGLDGCNDDADDDDEIEILLDNCEGHLLEKYNNYN